MWRPGTVGTADPPRTPQGSQKDVATLQAAGFGTADIERLQALRSVWPFVEWTDSQMSFDRLLFVRWRFKNGDLT